MALAKYSGFPAETKVSRRKLLSIAPTVSLGAVFTVAAATVAKGIVTADTPVRKLYEEWRSFGAWMEATPDQTLSEAEWERATAQLLKLMNDILDVPAQTAGDVIAKVIVYTDFGSCGLPDRLANAAFWQEAAALI